MVVGVVAGVVKNSNVEIASVLAVVVVGRNKGNDIGIISKYGKEH